MLIPCKTNGTSRVPFLFTENSFMDGSQGLDQLACIDVAGGAERIAT